MIAWATPLASTMATGSRITSARATAVITQATEIRRVHRVRDASSPGSQPPRIRPSATIRALPAAATKSVE